MSAISSTPIDAWADKPTASGRLFFLDLGAGRVLSANTDGSDLKTIINEGRKLPDGLALDVAAGHIYWTNMGDPKKNDGSIFRADLDGKNMVTIVPPGGTFTPKQLQVDKKSGKLYWSDREGMRVMRANLDGRKSKLSWTQARAIRARGRTRGNGVWVSRWTRKALLDAERR